jgi:hypothetical protein
VIEHRRNKIGIMSLEAHDPAEKQMKDAYRNYLPVGFADSHQGQSGSYKCDANPGNSR